VSPSGHKAFASKRSSDPICVTEIFGPVLCHRDLQTGFVSKRFSDRIFRRDLETGFASKRSSDQICVVEILRLDLCHDLQTGFVS
jgi:hypothetical protein